MTPAVVDYSTQNQLFYVWQILKITSGKSANLILDLKVQINQAIPSNLYLTLLLTRDPIAL